MALADLLLQRVLLLRCEQPRALARLHRLPLVVGLLDGCRVERPLALPLQLVHLKLLCQLPHLLLRAVARVVALIDGFAQA